MKRKWLLMLAIVNSGCMPCYLALLQIRVYLSSFLVHWLWRFILPQLAIQILPANSCQIWVHLVYLHYNIHVIRRKIHWITLKPKVIRKLGLSKQPSTVERVWYFRVVHWCFFHPFIFCTPLCNVQLWDVQMSLGHTPNTPSVHHRNTEYA